MKAYRAQLTVRPRPQLPPESLRERLPLMGWLIYEASWNAVQRIVASYDELPAGPERADSEAAHGQVRRLGNAARGLVWPEFAPRALGAIRAQALAESKRDTPLSYDEAWIYHREAKRRYRTYLDALGTVPERTRFVIALDEVLLQLALAETGTACRTAERVIGKWAEESPDAPVEEEERRVQVIYPDVEEAAETGARALAAAAKIRDEYGLVHEVTEDRMALVTGFRNPGIMCARAALIALALCPAMESIGLVQLRLNFALLVPGHSLPATAPFDPCLAVDPLDGAAVGALSAWLAPETRSSQRVRGNMIGSATLPLFIQSVMALRSLTGDAHGYLDWRREWPELGRYWQQGGREDPVDRAISAALRRQSLDVGRE
ncbi:hypothetical protein [Cryptosporangium phraense]|uniref:Uncharacterized protein n=1 Tax=Cryptosporangium phraense TaxID=2593070 RepID=A0A545AGA3_9ACTN|nr:hypothetical protein [Cryptosporangium phraense]TQS40359.1 hypothetical protein FL583_35085 [Cryptosporangium phraense]